MGFASQPWNACSRNDICLTLVSPHNLVFTYLRRNFVLCPMVGPCPSLTRPRRRLRNRARIGSSQSESKDSRCRAWLARPGIMQLRQSPHTTTWCTGSYVLQCRLFGHVVLGILHGLNYEKSGHNASTYKRIEQYPNPKRRSPIACPGRIRLTTYS